MTEEIKDLLSRIADYFDNKSDSVDGPEGEPRPNTEMKFAAEIDKILTAPPSKSFSKEQVIELLRQQRKNCVNAFLENGRNASSAGLILNAPAAALPQPDPENYTIRDAHDQLDFDGASYQDAIQTPQPTGEEEVNEVGLEMLATLHKIIHAIQHSNMRGTILHQEITAVVKKAMSAPFKINHGKQSPIKD